MKTNDQNDCLECMNFFTVSKGFNSEFCSQECRDNYYKNWGKENMINKNWDEELLIDLARKVVQEAEASAKENPSSEEILIVVVEPKKKPYKKMMKNELSAMNEIVEGYIEIINIGLNKKGKRFAITVNEEGKLMGLPANRRLYNFDTLVGTFFITAYNGEGDNVSLTNTEAEFYIKEFSPMDVYI
jgi:hypothetical protein